MTAPPLEVGMTYRCKGFYSIAVESDLLVTYSRGRFKTLSPQRGVEVLRNLSCRKLCEHWGAPVTLLDELAERFLKPTTCRDANPSDRSAERYMATLERKICRLRLAG
jgi:hypothetical protein